MGRPKFRLPIAFKTFFLCIVALIGILSCNDDTKDIEINQEPVVSTFYMIRHAEKDRTDINDKNPELNQKGLDRAIRWAEVFDPVVLDAIYSTDYKRTSMTAAPVSVKKDIDIQYYDPSTLDVETFKQDYAGKQVLIVGHSNTTPFLANKLLGEEKYGNMDDDDNSSLFIVRIIDGKATDMVLKMD